MRRFLRIFPPYYAFLGMLLVAALCKPVLRGQIPFAWLVTYCVRWVSA